MPEPAPAPVFSLNVEVAGNATVVHCHGRLVYGVTDVLYSRVRPMIPGTKRIVLDLSELKHMDSMGLGTLVRLLVAAKAGGCSLELSHLSKQIRNLLGLTDMLNVFTVIGESGIKLM